MGRLSSGGRRPTLVSFSGIDGAGKSTQIELLCNRLCEAGLRVRVLTFWDDVALLTAFRELTSHAVFKSAKGVGTPGQPVNRRDKNVQSWYMTPVRFLLYLLDAISLRFVVAKSTDCDVLIFDRYLYDELANLLMKGPLTRAYVRMLLRAAPTPSVAYLLDADAGKARERKPEYPIEFLHRSRASYLELSEMAGIAVVAPGPVEEVSHSILQSLLVKFPAADLLGPSAGAGFTASSPQA